MVRRNGIAGSRPYTSDAGTGTATKTSSVSGGMSPSYMAFSPDHAHAYAINEVDGANSSVFGIGSYQLTVTGK